MILYTYNTLSWVTWTSNSSDKNYCVGGIVYMQHQINYKEFDL